MAQERHAKLIRAPLYAEPIPRFGRSVGSTLAQAVAERDQISAYTLWVPGASGHRAGAAESRRFQCSPRDKSSSS